MIITTIEERIFFYRNEKGWSRAELARQIGTETGKEPGRDVISQYESGKRKVPSELVPVLAKIFGISTDGLFYKQEETRSHSAVKEAIREVENEGETDLQSALQKAIEALKEADRELQRVKAENDIYKQEKDKYEKENERLNSLMQGFKEYAVKIANS